LGRFAARGSGGARRGDVAVAAAASGHVPAPVLGAVRAVAGAPEAPAHVLSQPSPAPLTVGSPELSRIPQMRSGELRKLAEAAAAQGGDRALWDAIALRCAASAEQLQHWDMVLILQAFAVARAESRPLLLRFGEALSAKASQLAPRHVLDVFAAYEAHGLRPRTLYVELLHALARLSGSMYAEELSQTLQALARHRLGSPGALAPLARALRRQLGELRLRHLCGAAGALGALGSCPPVLLTELDARAALEVRASAPQELLDDLRALPLLEFSWRPYEELCLREFLVQLRSLRTAQDMDQLAEPFEVLALLRTRGLCDRGFLEALCQWCLRGVHRPNVRSERRPTAKQLVALHDVCREQGLEGDPALQDALRYYADSAGGVWPEALPQPLRYIKRRKYIRAPVRLELEAGPPDDALAERPPPPAELVNVSRHKPSVPSALVDEGESTVGSRITSRKGPRPRHRRDPGLKRFLRKNWPRAPLWIQGGWQMTPKYQPGVATARYPWAGLPVGKRGGAYIHRR